MNQYASKALTAAQKNFQMTENFARSNEGAICQNCRHPGAPTNDNPCVECGFPAPAAPKPESGIVRGVGMIRRDGESYTGRLTLHGFHYVLAADVAEDQAGKFFRLAVFDDMNRQICEIPLADLPIVAHDPRHNATQREMLNAISETFGAQNT